MVLAPVVIKFAVSFLNSGLKPAKLLVSLLMKAYNRLPTPDLDYPHAMRGIVWGLAVAGGFISYLGAGHTLTDSLATVFTGGLGAIGIHETMDSVMPKKPENPIMGDTPVGR